MARINIEDSLWKDDRFQDLMIRVGSRHTAKGMVLELWALAQEFWFPERKLIPRERIQRSGLDLMLDVGLAVEREGGIFAVGTEKAFDWLFQKQSAGKKGGRPKAGVKRPKADAKRAQANESGTNPLTLTLTPTLTLSSDSSSPTVTENSEIENPKTAGEGGGANEFIAVYCELWRDRYGTNPVIAGAPSGIAKRLVKNLGLKRAIEVVRAYLEMNSAWFVQKRHDLFTLERDLGAVVIYADTGNTVTQGELRQADKAQTNRNVWDSLKGKEGASRG